MIDILYGNSETPDLNRAIAEFVSVQIFGQPDGFRDYGSIGIFDDGKLIAGVVFYDWDKDAGVMQLSAASISKRWLTRRVIHTMFSIPFEQFACQMVVLRVLPTNETMCSIARRYGFDEYLIPRLAGRNTDQILFTLTDDKWRSGHVFTGATHG